MTCRETPTWVNRVGLVKVDDLGNGTGIFLGWDDARPSATTHRLYYNVYYSDTRFGVLTTTPQAITSSKYTTLYISDPGNVYYFAVKATEFDQKFEFNPMTQVGIDLYQYPAAQTLSNDLSEHPLDGYYLEVESVAGFPYTGDLIIGTEIMHYSAIDTDTNTFLVLPEDRGTYSSSIDRHWAGDAVALWRGVEDTNTVVRQGIATWYQETPLNVDAVGEFNVDIDGYKATNEDILTTDLKSSDENTQDFPSYDYTGYHRPSLQETFSGDCVGSYVGGEFNGGRGLFVNDRLLSQLDALLQTTGERVILLRRKWSGKRCKCWESRHEHQRYRCSVCYSVGFEGGYDRYVNTRPVSERYVNTDGCILIRVSPFDDNLKLEAHQGLVQSDELKVWTISVPTIKSKDIIVRFTEDFGIEEFRYIVTNVNRNKTIMGYIGQQTITMKRIDKTSPVYTFDISI